MKEIIINDRHFIVEDYTEPKVFYSQSLQPKGWSLSKGD